MRLYTANGTLNQIYELDIDTLDIIQFKDVLVSTDDELGASYNKLFQGIQNDTWRKIDFDTLDDLGNETITGGTYFAYYNGIDGDMENRFFNNTRYYTANPLSQEIEIDTYTVVNEELTGANRLRNTAALKNGNLYTTDDTNEVLKQDKDTLQVMQNMGYSLTSKSFAGGDNTIFSVYSGDFVELAEDGTILRQETSTTKYNGAIGCLKSPVIPPTPETDLKKLIIKLSLGKTNVYIGGIEAGHTHLGEHWKMQINKRYKEYKSNYTGNNTAEKTLTDIELILEASLLVDNNNNFLNSAYDLINNVWTIKTDYIGSYAVEKDIKIVSAYDDFTIEFTGIIEIAEVYNYNNDGKAKMNIRITANTEDIKKIRR